MSHHDHTSRRRAWRLVASGAMVAALAGVGTVSALATSSAPAHATTNCGSDYFCTLGYYMTTGVTAAGAPAPTTTLSNGTTLVSLSAGTPLTVTTESMCSTTGGCSPPGQPGVAAPSDAVLYGGLSSQTGNPTGPNTGCFYQPTGCPELAASAPNMPSLSYTISGQAAGTVFTFEGWEVALGNIPEGCTSGCQAYTGDTLYCGGFYQVEWVMPPNPPPATAPITIAAAPTTLPTGSTVELTVSAPVSSGVVTGDTMWIVSSNASGQYVADTNAAAAYCVVTANETCTALTTDQTAETVYFWAYDTSNPTLQTQNQAQVTFEPIISSPPGTIDLTVHPTSTYVGDAVYLVANVTLGDNIAPGDVIKITGTGSATPSSCTLVEGTLGCGVDSTDNTAETVTYTAVDTTSGVTSNSVQVTFSASPPPPAGTLQLYCGVNGAPPSPASTCVVPYGASVSIGSQTHIYGSGVPSNATPAPVGS
jgi:hypothetical protein